MKNIVLCLFFLGLPFSAEMVAQTITTSNIEFQKTYEKSKLLIESRRYSFVGEMVYENKTREQLNSDANILTIDNNQSSGNLKSLSSKSRTYDLNGSVENYSVVATHEKQNISVNFTMTSKQKSLVIEMDAKPNGKVFLKIKEGSAISFYVGKLVEL